MITNFINKDEAIVIVFPQANELAKEFSYMLEIVLQCLIDFHIFVLGESFVSRKSAGLRPGFEAETGIKNKIVLFSKIASFFSPRETVSLLNYRQNKEVYHGHD